MTATLLAMLVEEGKLNWITTLGELFADTVKPMHPAWEKVTLRQVLAHRAGLRFEPDGLAQVLNELVGRPPRAPLGTLPQQRLEIARQALSRPPGIPPDTKYWYSNVGYVLAGAVLEQLTGRAWEELMRERLFQPLGISTGGFGPPGTADKTEQAWGHSPVLGKPLDPRSPAAEIPLFNGPAALAHMTVADWAKGTQPGDTGRRLWHAGSNGRWNCSVVIAPEIDFAVLVVCNRGWHSIAAWKARQTLKALIRTFAPKRS
jgi:CubicO group peptidase (beta-lactamase class C family)